MSDLLRDIGARVRSALAPLAGPITHRVVTSYLMKTASAASVGATTVSLTSLPAGFIGIRAGDVLNLTTPRAFTTDTPAVAGVVTNAPLDGPLVTTLSSGASVTVKRAVETPCRGWPEDASQQIAVGVSLVTGSAIFNLLTDTLPSAPKVEETLVVSGRNWLVKAVDLDPTGAVWRCTCV